ncbi:MAG: hypothetical protein JEY99_15770 [Spirochaetales bacterium]|nr:hypothetical protein [Spirochaetales bacterium]
MAKYVAAVDIGTTGSKGSVFSLTGEMIASAYREYPCTYPKPGWVEQDADLLVRSAMEALSEAINKAASSSFNISSADIVSVSVSAQRCCGIFLDKDEKQLRPMISWQDNRTPVEVAEIEEKISGEEYYKKTGYPNSTTWLLSKMMWVRKNEPEVWAKTDRVVQMHDYFLRALGVDEYFVDYNDAGFFGIFDSVSCAWDKDLLNLFEIDPAILPVPAESGTKAGLVSKEASKLSGLAEGAIIAIGAGDQCAGSLGAGITGKGSLSISMGTAGAVNAYLDIPFRDPNGAGMVTCHSQKGGWLWEGHQAAAAGVYRWFRDEVAALEKVQTEESGEDFYELMNKKMEAVPAGSKGLVFLPYYAGAATPRYNSSARGTLVGLTFAHDRACMARAYLEGITLDMYELILAVQKSGTPVDDVRILGGPTKSALWNQIQADVYGIPVRTLNVTDATLLGAAILAAVGAGLFSSIKEGADEMVQMKEEYKPDAKNHVMYQDLYKLYCKVYDSLNGDVYNSLADFQERF